MVVVDDGEKLLIGDEIVQSDHIYLIERKKRSEIRFHPNHHQPSTIIHLPSTIIYSLVNHLSHNLFPFSHLLLLHMRCVMMKLNEMRW